MTILLAIVGVIGLVAGLSALGAWVIMVLQGAVVSEFNLNFSTWSFLQSLLVAVVLSVIGSFFSSSSSRQS